MSAKTKLLALAAATIAMVGGAGASPPEPAGSPEKLADDGRGSFGVRYCWPAHGGHKGGSKPRRQRTRRAVRVLAAQLRNAGVQVPRTPPDDDFGLFYTRKGYRLLAARMLREARGRR